MGLLAIEGPGPQLVVRRIGHRAGHQDGTDPVRLKRKGSVVLQQDDRLFHRLAGSLQMGRGILDRLGCLHVHIRILEESQQEFDTEDMADRLVNRRFLHLPAAHQFFQMRKETESHHVHIDTGIGRFHRHVFAIQTVTVVNHLAHRIPVRDDKPVKAPLIPKDILEDKCIGRRRDAVIVIE